MRIIWGNYNMEDSPPESVRTKKVNRDFILH